MSRIKIGEGSRYAVFLNPDHDAFLKIRIDGCVVKHGVRADWVLEKDRKAVVVELKGKNVEHGADQVSATAALWLRQLQRADAICGLIVCTQYPKASTQIQRKQQKFAREFKSLMRVVSCNKEHQFEKMFV